MQTLSDGGGANRRIAILTIAKVESWKTPIFHLRSAFRHGIGKSEVWENDDEPVVDPEALFN